MIAQSVDNAQCVLIFAILIFPTTLAVGVDGFFLSQREANFGLSKDDSLGKVCTHTSPAVSKVTFNTKLIIPISSKVANVTLKNISSSHTSILRSSLDRKVVPILA